jgi:hypothetical protein
MAKHIGVPPKSPNSKASRRLDVGAMKSRTKKKVRRKIAPAAEYPPGYFTALIRRHNWPPGFRSAIDEEKT